VKTLFDYYGPKIVEVLPQISPERDPRSCQPGDSILFEIDGVAFTLLEELLRDGTHVTWRTLITAHPDDERLGQEEWIAFNLTIALPDDRVIVRG
jgi:hypothetical protein